jgi:hypothetical protein
VANEPVMAVVRVKVPADVETGVLEAELIRAMWKRSVVAEFALLPSSWAGRSGSMRRHGFVALLCAGRPQADDELAAVTQKAVRKVLRRRFGSSCRAKVRLARQEAEVKTAWLSVRGSPCRL